ncbi:Acyl-CoA N-acyltransferase [Naviculisporaceae sp. PSN 640]
MPYLVRPATEADAPAIAAVGRESFRDGIGQLMYPPRLSHRTLENTPADAEGAPFMDEWTWQVQKAKKRMQMMMTIVLVDSDAQGPDGQQEILGFAHWEAPKGSEYYRGPLEEEEHKEAEKKVEVLAPVPPTYDRTFDKRCEEQFEFETKRVLGENGHKDMWYLAVLCVAPQHQGKGVGKKLLQWGMARGAEERKSLFLLASTEGYPLYRSQGFQTIGEFHLLDVLHSRAMILPAPFPTLDPKTVLNTEVAVEA